MSHDSSAKYTYLPIIPPRTLSEPLPLTVEGPLIDALNEYRHARHAFYSMQRDGASSEQQDRIRREFQHQGELLAMRFAVVVSSELNEPSDWSRD